MSHVLVARTVFATIPGALLVGFYSALPAGPRARGTTSVSSCCSCRIPGEDGSTITDLLLGSTLRRDDRVFRNRSVSSRRSAGLVLLARAGLPVRRELGVVFLLAIAICVLQPESGARADQFIAARPDFQRRLFVLFLTSPARVSGFHALSRRARRPSDRARADVRMGDTVDGAESFVAIGAIASCVPLRIYFAINTGAGSWRDPVPRLHDPPGVSLDPARCGIAAAWVSRALRPHRRRAVLRRRAHISAPVRRWMFAICTLRIMFEAVHPDRARAALARP